MANVEQVLDALGDPTRRKVLRRLREGAPSVRAIATGLGVTPSAISQHLRVLLDAELVSVRAQGTRRIYSVDPRGLTLVRIWLDGFWDEALDAFKVEAERAALAHRREDE